MYCVLTVYCIHRMNIMLLNYYSYYIFIYLLMQSFISSIQYIHASATPLSHIRTQNSTPYQYIIYCIYTSYIKHYYFHKYYYTKYVCLLYKRHNSDPLWLICNFTCFKNGPTETFIKASNSNSS